MSENDAPLYRVPGLLNPRLAVWAIDCGGCGKQLRLGPGSKAGIRRMLAVTGTRCGNCASTTRSPDSLEAPR